MDRQQISGWSSGSAKLALVLPFRNHDDDQPPHAEAQETTPGTGRGWHDGISSGLASVLRGFAPSNQIIPRSRSVPEIGGRMIRSSAAHPDQIRFMEGSSNRRQGGTTYRSGGRSTCKDSFGHSGFNGGSPGRQSLLEIIHSGVGDTSLVEAKGGEVVQPLEMCDVGVGDLRSDEQ